MNVRKATGPDGITGRVLRSCADQLAGLFTSIFNESLATSVVTTSFKKSVIIPVPKNSKPSCLNDYRPVTLTLIVMQVFERLVKNHLCSSIPVTLNPFQFSQIGLLIVLHLHLSRPALFTHTHWQQQWELCKAAFHWLYLSFQYYSPHQASFKTHRPRPKLHSVTGFKISSPADLKWWKWASSPPTPSPWT